MPLSETEYNGDCRDQYYCSLQDTMMFANLTGYTKLIAKSNGPVQLPRFLEFGGSIREMQSGLNTSLHEGECWSLRNWKALGAMDSSLKRLCCMPLKTARLDQIHV